MTPHREAVVLTICMPPSSLMNQAKGQLFRKYERDIIIRTANVSSSSRLLELASQPNVVAVVIGEEHRSIVNGILAKGWADVFVISGHGASRTLKMLTATGQLIAHF